MGDRLFPLASSGEHCVDLSLSQLNVPALLKRHGLRPDKSLGQNFLVDSKALYRVAESAGITQEDQVLEIGAGTGSLTRILSTMARRVVAIEIDPRLIPILREVLTDFHNTKIVEGDILSVNLSDLFEQPGYLVVANIPYYITSALIRHLLESAVRPRCLVLTVQREVAERICAEPGDMSLLSLSVQVYGRPRVLSQIPAGAFFPVPKVDSSIVRVDLFDTPRIREENLPAFFRLAKAGFSQKRKTIRNALAGGLAWNPKQAEDLLHAAQIDPLRRAETLDLGEWNRMVEEYLTLTKV